MGICLQWIFAIISLRIILLGSKKVYGISNYLPKSTSLKIWAPPAENMSSSIVIYNSLKDVMPRKQNITSSLTHLSVSFWLIRSRCILSLYPENIRKPRKKGVEKGCIRSKWVKGTWPTCLYFAGCFLCLWKLMLPYLKSIWEILLKISRQFSTRIDGITQTLLCNKYMGVIHILFKEHVINNCLVYR